MEHARTCKLERKWHISGFVPGDASVFCPVASTTPLPRLYKISVSNIKTVASTFAMLDLVVRLFFILLLQVSPDAPGFYFLEVLLEKHNPLCTRAYQNGLAIKKPRATHEIIENKKKLICCFISTFS